MSNQLIIGGKKVIAEEDGDNIVFTSEIDLTGHIEDIKRQRLEYDAGAARKSSLGYKAAEIPMDVLIWWGTQHNFDPFDSSPETSKKLHALLNDPDNAVFRVWEGRL